MKRNYSADRSEFVRCNLCGSAAAARFMRFEDFIYVKCRNCGFVYQNPMPVFNSLKKRYLKKYFNYELRNEENFFNLTRLSLKDIDFFNMKLPNRRFLDIGCATGRLLEYVRSFKFRVNGVELCPQSANYARKKRGLEVFCGTIESADFSPGVFGAINLSHVIEHLPDPFLTMLEIKRILAPGGIFMVTTPNIGGWQAWIFGKKWRCYHRDHVYLFDKKTLRSLLNKAGFSVIGAFSWGGIEEGKTSVFIKRTADKLAKRLDVGDVQFCYVRRSASS